MIETLARFEFGSGQAGNALLKEGWCEPEPGFVWSCGARSSLTVPAPGSLRFNALELMIDPRQTDGPAHRTVAVSVTGTTTGTTTGQRRLGGPIAWQIPLSGAFDFPLDIVLALDGADTPERLGVQLSALRLLHVPEIVFPPTARPVEALRFGWNEDTDHALAHGFGAPEDAYAWALGSDARLRLPVPGDGAPLLALLDMRPFETLAIPARQRVAVYAEGAGEMVLDLRAHLIQAISLNPARGQRAAEIHFRNLDAVLQADAPVHASGKPFAWALASARIVPALPRYLPGARPRLPGNLEDGTMQHAVTALTGLTLPALLDRYESLGNGCEIGILQQQYGLDRISLLRFSGISQRSLIDGLFDGFPKFHEPERYGWEPPTPQNFRWRLTHDAYVFVTETPFPASAPPPVNEGARSARRLPRLAQSLLEDIATGERIFALRLGELAEEPALLAVLAALRRYGEAEFLWLSDAGLAPPGTVDRLPCGLIRGHLDPKPDPEGRTYASLVSVLANAFVLLRQTQRIGP